MKFEFKCFDPGDYQSPSKWVVFITNNDKTELFDYQQGSYYRRLKNKPLSRFLDVKIPQGWKLGERIPQVYGNPTYDQHFLMLKHSEPMEPDPADVLFSLAADYQSIQGIYTFEQWAHEFGYSSDSRKAEQTYNKVRENCAKIDRLGIDMNMVAEC